MNIQELNTISNKQLPIKIFVMNNRALGHILLFQEHYLDSRFVATSEKQGDFYSCNFVELAKAYNIRAISLKDEKDILNYREILLDSKPALFELEYEDCSILPNIHAGDDCLIAGPELPKCVVSKIKGWMNL